MSQTIAKIGRRIEELAALRYRETQAIEEVYLIRLDIDPEAQDEIALRQGDRWSERDVVYCVRLSCAVPTHWRKKVLALRLDFSAPPAPNEWTISTVEGMLFLDGLPFHAVDRYHREIVLSPDVTGRAQLDVRLNLWSGLDEVEHSAHRFELCLLDEPTMSLYQKMMLLYDACTQFAETSATHQQLVAALNEACNRLDFRQTRAMLENIEKSDIREKNDTHDKHDKSEIHEIHTETFYTSVQEALHRLDAQIRAMHLQETAWQPRAIVTGHAHIDVAWLWRLQHTRMKAAHTFSTVLYHMDRYPLFTFTQSQPQLYAFVQQDYPELFARIKRKVEGGQWEPEGAMWVEADTNIPGGESLVRQFLHGQRYFQREFGRYSRVLWLPDVFGYSAVLPQLMKGAGVDYFVTTKISWNDTNRIPMDTFWWEGIDGTRVLGYFITARHEGDRWSTYSADLKPAILMRGWQEYRQKAINNEMLVAYGWGDGGGGPTREMIEAIEELASPISQELPVVVSGSVADFMQRLQTRVGQDPRLPVWVGELYLEYHRGTYTSQARVKQANRFIERDLHNAEWLASMTQVLLGRDYPLATFDQLWKPFLTNQFHDILPGSAIGPVYVDALETYAQIQEVTQRVIEQEKHALVEAIEAQEGALVVFNSTGWQRTGIIHIANDLLVPPGLLRQRLADGSTLVRVQNVPALGYALLMGDEQEQGESSSLYATPNLLENRFYRIELDAHGHIVQLWDKQAESGAGRTVIPVGQHANVFQLFEDKPINFDAWDIDTFYEEKMWELDDPEITVVEKGPLRAGVQLVWSYQQRTRIVQQIYLYEHSRRIDFVTSVDWQERQTLLKVAFPVAVHATYATAEIQFGTIARPTHRNTSWDQARFETVGHRWIDLSEAGYGVAILNDCKYGYDVHANVMRLTLLKGAISPDPLADVGRHTFTYSLLPHDGDWSSGQVQRQAYELNSPLLYALKTSTTGTQIPSLSLVSCDQEHVVIETVKHAESEPALIFRIYECANRRGPFQLHWSFPAVRVWETNLLEDVKKEVHVLDEGKTLIGRIQPYEIKTFLVYYAPQVF